MKDRSLKNFYDSLTFAAIYFMGVNIFPFLKIKNVVLGTGSAPGMASKRCVPF
jgi:hypothetical protein